MPSAQPAYRRCCWNEVLGRCSTPLLSTWLQAQGLDAIHCLDLPQGNATPDVGILKISLEEQRVVITKDRDFQHSFLLQGKPFKLLLISTGNLNNTQLIARFQSSLGQLLEFLQRHDYIEICRDQLLLHN